MANKTMADYTRKIKPYLKGVAPIEPTSTAAFAHAVGDVFYVDGLLVKCTTAISVGDTIIVSPTTNYNVEESADIVTQIKNGGGGGGTYTAGNGINIDANNVISSDSVIFTGTKEEWEELTLEEKIQYTHAAWVGDEQSGAIDPVPTEDSNNLMTSGGIYDALLDKANVTAISNPNLLDNPWFTVNQRGQSSYVWDTDIGYRYTVDRWQAYKPNIQVTSDGVVYAYSGGTEAGSNFSVFRQFIEDYSYLAGKTVTLSTIVNGTLYKATGVFPSAAGDPSISIVLGTGITMYVAFQTGQNYPKVSITNFSTTSITIRAIKLELGSVSTLAMDTAPNYQQELAKCERYFQRFTKGKHTVARPLWMGIARGVNSAQMFISLPTEMRSNIPTVSFSGIDVMNLSGTVITGVTFSLIELMGNVLVLDCQKTNGFTAGSIVLLRTEGSGYIDISADL